MLIALILLLVYVSVKLFKDTKSKIQVWGSQKDLKVYRLNDEMKTHEPSLLVNKTFEDMMDAYPTTFSYTDNFADTNMLMFETFNYIDKILSLLSGKWPSNLLFVNGLRKTDELVSKSTLAKYMKDCVSCLPETYILDNAEDMSLLKRLYNENNVYICKKNIQRQQGVLITKELDDIISVSCLSELDPNKQKQRLCNDYVVCQQMLQDPLLINGYKINMRVYLLVVVSQMSCDWYAYTDGFIYYAPKRFVPNSTDADVVITTGYVDRSMYDRNPLTFQDLKVQLGMNDFDVLFQNILCLLRMVKVRYCDVFTAANKDVPGIKFSLFGCDIAPSADLGVKLMEVNKGPDITYKDERDGCLKKRLVIDTFQKVGAIVDDGREPNLYTVV